MTKSLRERYPGPWIIEEARESMIVRTRCGRQVAQIFAEDMESRRHVLGHMTWAEARAIAKAIAALADDGGRPAHNGSQSGATNAPDEDA